MAEEQKSVGTTIKGLDIYIDSRELEREINNTVGGFKPQALLKLIGQTHLYWINKNFVKHGIEVPWAPLRQARSPTRSAEARERSRCVTPMIWQSRLMCTGSC